MTKVRGIKRTSEITEIEVSSHDLLQACKAGLENEHFVQLLRDRIQKIIISCSPELQDRAVMISEFSGKKMWLVEDGYDSHKGEATWVSVRDVTEEESKLLDWCKSFKEILDFHEDLVKNNKGDK